MFSFKGEGGKKQKKKKKKNKTKNKTSKRPNPPSRHRMSPGQTAARYSSKSAKWIAPVASATSQVSAVLGGLPVLVFSSTMTVKRKFFCPCRRSTIEVGLACGETALSTAFIVMVVVVVVVMVDVSNLLSNDGVATSSTTSSDISQI